MASSSTKWTLKLLIDTKREVVIFAEASKPVVDFLFSLLCLPLTTVTRLLPKNGMAGSLVNLYESVENLDESYMQPNQRKDVLLKPTTLISSAHISGLLPENDDPVNETPKTKLYACPNHSGKVTCDDQTRCPHCSYTMSYAVDYVGNKPAEDVSPNKTGFVKEVVTYMVMDDLVIQPMSSISSITLLNKFNIKEVGVLEEKVVELGMTEGLNLLKASLESKTVLTSVFLKNTTPSGHQKDES